MNTLERLEKIASKITNKEISLTSETDLLSDTVLDSLDSMMFFLQIEEEFGVKIPEDIDLKAEGYYKISKLIEIID